jgi:hypothetical protein
MPIQKTKLVMSQAQLAELFSPQTPTPVRIRYRMPMPASPATLAAMPVAMYHQSGVGFSMAEAMRSPTQVASRLFVT